MKKVTFLFLTLFLVSAFYSQVNAQLLLKDRFDSPAGTKLISSGWIHTGNATTDTIKVEAGNLTYGSYPYSTTTESNMVLIKGKVAYEDVHKNFTDKVSSGTVYTSFLVKVDTATETGDYFFHYWANSTMAFDARLYVKDNKAGQFTFGLGKTSTPTYTTAAFDYKKTYLVVVKYEVVGDTAGTDDKVSLFVNPGVTEPASADIAATNGTSDKDVALYGVALRQGSGAPYRVYLDGIRSATMWDSLDISSAIPVTFQANMKVMMKEGKFKADTDKMVIRGSFQTDAGDTGDWQGTKFELQDPEKDSIYALTVNFPAAKVGTTYQYKLVLAPDGWESNQPNASGNREFTLTAPSMVLYPAFYNNDSVVTASQYAGLKFKITFTADISSIYNKGFDPEKDSLLIQGLDWDGLGTAVVGSRKLTETLIPGQFETTLQVTALADSVTFKYRLFPNGSFGDGGWEQINRNRAIYFKDFAGADSMALPLQTPKFIILKPGITKAMTVLFQVKMEGAKNQYDGSDIPLNALQFVGVKGADTVIGAWQGNWVVTDTTSKYMLPLNDKGQFGDKVAGDNIWSREVVYKVGTPSGERPFKFGAWYTGADQHSNNNPAVLDNEAGYGQNHTFNLIETPNGRIELLSIFGNTTVGVKEVKGTKPTEYQLTQNYPNPFNPSTTIRYSVPRAGLVSLKIYNTLGQVVATLVNAQQEVGTYSVSFDASKLSSGIYLYNLTSGSFSQTKKMLLVK